MCNSEFELTIIELVVIDHIIVQFLIWLYPFRYIFVFLTEFLLSNLLKFPLKFFFGYKITN